MEKEIKIINLYFSSNDLNLQKIKWEALLYALVTNWIFKIMFPIYVHQFLSEHSYYFILDYNPVEYQPGYDRIHPFSCSIQILWKLHLKSYIETKILW